MIVAKIEPSLARIQFGRLIPMRDGVRLSADLYLPLAEGPHPAIVLRTPYVKAGPRYTERAMRWARDGYAFVLVDVRGRGDSEGDFLPYRRDADDGYDVIEWIAAQPWCTGAVATTGASYSGRIQWITALTRPPHLKAMIPMVAPSDTFVEFPTGVPSPMDICWYHMTSGRTMQDTDPVDWLEVYRHLPLETMDEALGRDIPRWREVVSHQTLDDYWRVLSYQHRFAEIDLPVLHISGWYDDEQIGTPLNFTGMVEHGASPFARENQHLLMGPWGHQVNGGTRLGEVEFGQEALIDLHALERQFLDRHLKGLDVPKLPPVRIFLMGENRWRDEPTWPPTAMRQVPYYLHSREGAQSRFGDGRLDLVPPGDEPTDSFTYDPRRPVPFLTDPTSSQIGGPDDYSAVERRDDVLCYTSEPTAEPLDLIGPISLVLHAATSARDTDFTAKLVDVWPSGFCQRLTDSIVRLRYRDGFDAAQSVTPGEVYELTIDLWNTCLRLQPGHRLRLEISSSAFPKFPLNLNTGDDLATGTAMAVAEQQVFHDRARPSRLLLPIVR